MEARDRQSVKALIWFNVKDLKRVYENTTDELAKRQMYYVIKDLENLIKSLEN